MIRRLFMLCAMLACTVLKGSAEEQTAPYAGTKLVAVSTTPVSVVDIPHAPLLTPRAGWILESEDSDFGGLSALAVRPGHFTAISDTGLLVRIDRRGEQARLESLPQRCVPHQLKRERDSESLALDPRTGALWIGFEYRNAICRIGVDGEARLYAPPAMAHWPRLAGPEAMLRRDDGSFLVFAERAEKGGPISPLLLFDRDPTDPRAKVTALSYRAPPQYHPVDAAMLPDGRMLVVNRRYAFPLDFSAIVTLVEPFAPRQGAVIEGHPVIVLAPPHIADNFEGISVEKQGAETRIWLVSDNNFLPQQRTYLMEFVLVQPGSGRDR